jgi:outer membrane protein assembly factor BamE (lipoprotein component of BamABCDE complex)
MNFKACALLLPLMATLPLGGCFTSTYTHGHVITSNMMSQVQVGSSREQVELVLGSPSTRSSLDGDAYYYIQCASTASSRSATMLVILIIGFTAGPAVSL